MSLRKLPDDHRSVADAQQSSVPKDAASGHDITSDPASHAAPTYTPGPWEVITHGRDGVDIRATQHPSPTICLVTGGLDDPWNDGMYGPTTHANAHLIAAAPDLLEALKHLSREISGLLSLVEPELREAAGNTNVAVLHQRLDESAAALRKAEGKE